MFNTCDLPQPAFRVKSKMSLVLSLLLKEFTTPVGTSWQRTFLFFTGLLMLIYFRHPSALGSALGSAGFFGLIIAAGWVLSGRTNVLFQSSLSHRCVCFLSIRHLYESDVKLIFHLFTHCSKGFLQF